MERAYFSELGNAREEINAWNSEKSLTINVSAQSSSPLWWANFGDAGESGVLLKHLNDETEAGRPKFDRPMDDVERLVEEQKRAEEVDLIDFEAVVNDLVVINDDQYDDWKYDNDDEGSKPLTANLSELKKSAQEKKRLPKNAIIYDYSVQPVVVKEINRKFLPHLNAPSVPFLRPIVIDGVGLIKAHRNCCCTNTTYYPFPLVPMLRCLFYWISKGHSTVLSFPSSFNPTNNSCFNANSAQKEALLMLKQFRLAVFFNTNDRVDNKAWYSNVLERYKSCLITTLAHWHFSMPNNLTSGVFQYESARGYYGYCRKGLEKSSKRLLQPFFSHDSKLIFFSSFSASGACVAEMILEGGIMTDTEYEQLKFVQMSFVEQARMLQLIYSYLPENARFRETTVMVEVLRRLKDYLP